MPRRLMLLAAAFVVLGLWDSAAAGRQRPRASPHDSTSATIDGAELSIAYGRPYMRGRVIMGGLVPYGRVWCPGADEATTLTTTRGLTIGELKVEPGRYTLWMLPSADAWQLIVNRQTGQWHTQYDARQDFGRVALDKRQLEKPVEQLTFDLRKNGAGRGATIAMRWETTEVSAAFTVQ